MVFCYQKEVYIEVTFKSIIMKAFILCGIAGILLSTSAVCQNSLPQDSIVQPVIMLATDTRVNVSEPARLTHVYVKELATKLSELLSADMKAGNTKSSNAIKVAIKQLYAANKTLRLATLDSTLISVEIDSLQTVNRIAETTVEINRLSALKLSCPECDQVSLNAEIFALKNERNRLRRFTQSWLRKPIS